jgi:hypothetical protein
MDLVNCSDNSPGGHDTPSDSSGSSSPSVSSEKLPEYRVMTLIVGRKGKMMKLQFHPTYSSIMKRLFRTESSNGPFGETIEDDVVDLPDENPDDIQFFVDWLQGRDEHPRGDTPKYLRILCDLYKFASKIPSDILQDFKMDHALMDSTINMIHYTVHRYNLFFNLEDVIDFRPSDGSDSGLYKFALATFTYKWILNHQARASGDWREAKAAMDYQESQYRKM